MDGEASEECSAEYQEKLKEKETESVDLESVIVCDGFSQDSAKSTMKTWIFEDHEPYLKDHENTSSVSFAFFFFFLGQYGYVLVK